MKILRRFRERVNRVLFFFSSIILCYFPALISSAVVTLDSIEMFRTHEWLPTKPTLYFQCKGENKTALPDVKKKHISYSFKGEESWQPLTELPEKKCKRCGLYEKDPIKSDYTFDEWEFCASDFSRLDGKYIHFKDKEFNATFLCSDCIHVENDANRQKRWKKQNRKRTSGQPHISKNDTKGLPWILIMVISASVLMVFLAGLVSAYKYWTRRKRQQEQARFLKLFEEIDDIEDELGYSKKLMTLRMN